MKQPNLKNFMQVVVSTHKSSRIFLTPSPSRVKIEQNCFIIRHFANDVHYSTVFILVLSKFIHILHSKYTLVFSEILLKIIRKSVQRHYLDCLGNLSRHCAWRDKINLSDLWLQHQTQERLREQLARNSEWILVCFLKD